ncbi:MAG TPA: hypothetical protein VMR25_18275 [Planctomycetaceae bacterium]|jgi:hypothetical protein|nr:hypothetical protein [Planctomycetaceae bacterium]
MVNFSHDFDVYGNTITPNDSTDRKRKRRRNSDDFGPDPIRSFLTVWDALWDNRYLVVPWYSVRKLGHGAAIMLAFVINQRKWQLDRHDDGHKFSQWLNLKPSYIEKELGFSLTLQEKFLAKLADNGLIEVRHDDDIDSAHRIKLRHQAILKSFEKPK